MWPTIIIIERGIVVTSKKYNIKYFILHNNVTQTYVIIEIINMNELVACYKRSERK